MNGRNGGHSSLLHSADAEAGFAPLNLEASSSAPIHGNSHSFSRSSSAKRPPALGRATSSKRCIIVACVAAALTIALGVGLGVGLSSGGDDTGSSDTAGGAGEPVASPPPAPPTFAPATLMAKSADGTYAPLTSLSDACQRLAQGNYWETLAPTTYSLNLTLTGDMFKPSTGPLTFDASLDITFNVTAPTSCVVLNARDLNFTSVAVGGAAVCSSAAACISDGDAVSAPFARFQAVQGSSGAQLVSTGDEDLVAIDLGAAQLTPQSGTLSLRYTGLLGRIVGGGETGLLRSRSFVPLGGNASEVLVATQGAQNGGRKILPCYDQPRFKAVFEVAVQVPNSVKQVLSNGRCVQTRTLDAAEPTLRTWACDATPGMSTYLLALAAGSIDEVPPLVWSKGQLPATGNDTVDTWADDLQVRVWSAGADPALLQLATLVAKPAFVYYASQLGVVPGEEITTYNLLAIPGKKGAMENWGLLLFDERRFLYNQTSDGAHGLFEGVSVICHEIAHQWFGNLITKQDWTLVSVDEGIASFLEYKCMNYLGSTLAAQNISTADGASLQSLGVSLLKNTVNATFFRSSTPQLEQPGIHEAPVQVALATTSDPATPPIVPQTDLYSGTGSYPQYAKPAALLRMFELFLAEAEQSDNSRMPTILSTLAKTYAYRTYHWGDFFEVAYQVLVDTQRNDTTHDDTLVPLVQQRTQGMWNADTWQANWELVTTAVDSGDPAKATLAPWFYMPSYPIFAFDNSSHINASNYFATTSAFGLTARPYCAYTLEGTSVQEFEIPESVANATGDSVQSLVDSIAYACGVPAGLRFFPSTLAFDNLTACSYDSTAYGNWSTNWASIAGGDSWVDNQYGAKLFRSVYSQEHCNHLIVEMENMKDVCDAATTEADNAQGNCCTRQSDLLEGAALLGDMVALAQAQDPMTQLADVNLTVPYVLDALRRVLTGGDKANGQWQFLLGGASVDALFALKRMEEAGNCTREFSAFVQRHLDMLVQAVREDWLPDASADAAPQDFLKQLAGPRFLWQVGMLPQSSQNTTIAGVVEDVCALLPRTPLFKRYLLPQLGLLAVDDAADADTPTADFLPAVYMIGAAMPQECAQSILDAANGTTVSKAQLPERFGWALQDCYRNSADLSEALRCLYALPMLGVLADPSGGDVAEVGANHTAVQLLTESTLPWLFGNTTNGTALSIGGCNTVPTNAGKQRCSERYTDVTSHLPTLVSNAARLTSWQYQAAVSFLQANWDSLLPGLSDTVDTTDVRCTTVEQLPPPPTEATNSQLTDPDSGLLASIKAKGCPASTFVRSIGRAAQFSKLLTSQAADVCDYVKTH
ncbi:hypothetical protein ABPG77_008727 [Micractinium sp. CCAP 211/92]